MISTDAAVLVVDDDPSVGKVIGGLLRQAGIGCETVLSAEVALLRLAARPFEVLVTDVRMPGLDGMELLTRVRAKWPETAIVLMTAHATVPLAVEAMKRGAADFVLKPFDRDELLFVIGKALAKAQHAELRGALSSTGAFVGRSPAMLDCYRRLGRVAAGTATVLLRGETGTGKEVAANAIHQQSPRRGGPFVAVHCAALPEALLESELFGHERGAFTGAVAARPGRVEMADGGTLLLDEIGDIPPSVQVKLLRLIQQREYQRLGGTETHKADVRFIAATHRDLEAEVAAGRFRDDLFHRLNVVPLWLPPLRDRPEDIEPLIHHLCAELGQANHRPHATIRPDAVALLSAQRWGGNVRELRNFIERLIVMSERSDIDAVDVAREIERALPPSAAHATPRAETPPRRELDRHAVEEALRQSSNNRTLASRLLGVSRRTLYNKLGEFGLV